MTYMHAEPIGDNLYRLGTLENPVFAWGKADNWTLIEGGCVPTFSMVRAQLQELVSDLRYVRHWIITHSHYDHCGLLEPLLPYLENVQVYASSETVRLLQDARYLAHIRKQNAQLLNATTLETNVPMEAIHWAILEEGDVWQGSGISLEVIHTPGHSACSLSFWEPGTRTLLVADALGEWQAAHQFFPLAFQSFSLFRSSIEKLQHYTPKRVVVGHNAVLTGTQATQACTDALSSVDAFFAYVQHARDQNLGTEQIARQLTEKFGALSASFLPGDLHYLSMIKLLKNMPHEAIC